jgi:hypothetical protein
VDVKAYRRNFKLVSFGLACPAEIWVNMGIAQEVLALA